MTAFESFYESVGKKYGVKIAYKDKSIFMKFLNIFVQFFNSRFMTNYITVFRKTVYFPSKQWLDANPNSAAEILAHEIVHMYDNNEFDKKAFPGVSGFLYLFPQSMVVFTLLSFLAFINITWLFCLLFFLALLPIPSPYRFWAETRAYSLNMFYTSLELKDRYRPWEHAEQLSNYFTSWEYFKMWPFKLSVTAKLMVNYLHLPNKHPVFSDVQIWFYSFYR